jgi:hypothetical protein
MSRSDETRTTAPTWLARWSDLIRRMPVRQEPHGTITARGMTTTELKAAWDRYDGTDESIGIERLTGEAIHLVLNERGEGQYCAV